MRADLLPVAALTLALMVQACGTEPLCDAESIRAALAVAGPGDRVDVGACRVVGSFTVPAGVTLRGQGGGGPGVESASGGTVIVAEEDQVAVTLTPGALPSALENLRIEGPAKVAILARGDGGARVHGVEVATDRGIGLGVDGVGAFDMSNVRLTGTITEDNSDDPRWLHVVGVVPKGGACPTDACECMPGERRDGDQACGPDGRWATHTATHGMILVNVTGRIEDLAVTGYASFGVVAVDSSLVIQGADVTGNLGVGVHVLGGEVELAASSVCRSLQGIRGAPPFGALATDAALLSSTDLRVCDNDRFGLVHVGARAQHENLIATGNGDVGLWVGESDGFTLSGSASRIDDNAFAGVVVTASTHVVLRDAHVGGTRETERLVGMAGSLRIGDGIHLIDSRDDVALADLSVADHDRAGLLVELDEDVTAAPSFDNVSVAAGGGALGAIAGRRLVSGGRLVAVGVGDWDTGIVRLGDLARIDGAFSGELDAVAGGAPDDVPNSADVVGVIGPMY